MENLAHLPTKITRFTENNEPVLAQWNYRIACHPISGKLFTSYFEPRYDSASQRQRRRDQEQYVLSRAARFDIEGINVTGHRELGAMDYNLLDSIMEQIPGKDNYGANIPGKAFDGSGDDLFSANPETPDKKLNLGYYHRAFAQKSAEGTIRKDQRSFSDRVFIAHTTQDRIAPHTYTNSYGEVIDTKVSFAIPVEVIWLTPLHSWNPLGIELSDEREPGGKGTVADPFIKAGGKQWYLTPTEFFSGGEVDSNPADTSSGEVIMKTPSGARKVRASGTRIMFPKIDGIEKQIRQRYPIMPIHGEGSALWKKLNALEDAMGFEKAAVFESAVSFQTGTSHSAETTGHEHFITFEEEDVKKLRDGDVSELTAQTTRQNGHNHEIVVALNKNVGQEGQQEFYIKSCDHNDDGTKVCFDHHSNTLTQLEV